MGSNVPTGSAGDLSCECQYPHAAALSPVECAGRMRVGVVRVAAVMGQWEFIGPNQGENRAGLVQTGMNQGTMAREAWASSKCSPPYPAVRHLPREAEGTWSVGSRAQALGSLPGSATRDPHLSLPPYAFLFSHPWNRDAEGRSRPIQALPLVLSQPFEVRMGTGRGLEGASYGYGSKFPR